ncbi:MAG: hypothetical protein KQH63_17095 [Desulfobulbaceae bacterium]|nr:hypothetical protein [Desulfobulbaceae bacterium]
MSPRKRVILLVFIMAATVLVVEAITLAILYHTALDEEKSRLEETVRSQACLIEAISRFDKTYSNGFPFGARQATLLQIKDAHSNYKGFGETGEFTLSTRKNDQIIFLLSHRHHDLDNPMPVPWDSGLAEPMKLALSGKSGTIIGLDYRGETVVAAYEPVRELDLGIVAKVDLSEIQAPFVKAGIISGIFAMVMILLGVVLFFQVTNPMLKRLQDTVAKLEKALREVKTLRGILPICSYCKKIRDDEGYWDQVEVYLKKRSDADFSHGICPSCLEERFPEEFAAIQKEKLE